MLGRNQFRRAVFVVVAVAFASALIAVLISPPWHDADPPARIQAGPHRLEARLTTLGYGSLPTVPSQRGVANGIDYDVLAELQEAVGRSRVPESLHRLAIAQLAYGQAEAAHALLEEAIADRPGDAGILSDMAVAKLALGHVADAAEYSASALEVDPDHEVAAFNWALSLEQLSNRPAAIVAWKQYLDLDGGTGWAAEARKHLSRLDRPRTSWEQDYALVAPGTDPAALQRLIAMYPQHVRARAYNVLLPQWAETGDPALLALSRTIGVAREAAGDPFVADVVEHAATRRLALQPGLRAITAARAASTLSDGTRLWAEAAAHLQRAGSPLEIAADMAVANYYFYDAKADLAMQRLARIDANLEAASDRYPSMRTEAEWIRALILMRGGDPQACLRSYQRALEESMRIGEFEHEVFLRQLISTQLEMVGDPLEAERYRRDALRRMDETNPDESRMYVAYLETAFSALRAGRPRVALAFVNSQSGIARKTREPMYLAESSSQRALGLLELGQVDRASVSIAAARNYANVMPAGGFRDRTLSDVEYTAGRIAQVRGKPVEALKAYSAAIDIWVANKWRIHSANGYLARGEAALSAGDRAGAEADFRASISEIEAQRETLDEPALRIAYFERADRVFERLTELLVSEGRTNDALSIAERKRARCLLDQIAGTPTETPLDSNGIERMVTGRTAMIELTLLDRGAEMWLVYGGRTVHARSTASRAQIEAAVARHRAAIEASNLAAVLHEGRLLFDQLIGPITRGLPPDADLVIIPDGVLATFPFATLVKPNGRFLIDDHALAVTPSASVFLRAAAPSSPGALLGVAQPAPHGFDRLRGAEEEVAEIIRYARRGRMFVGTEITAKEFLRAAEDASLVHFSGHAKADEQQSSQSSLLFETLAGPPDALTAATIARSRLRARPLVVLAACSTGRGKRWRNEGIDSLAASFLQAGARGVVATLWDVDDERSSSLFRSFHRNLRAGARPADALREAQRALLHSTDPSERDPAVWGSAVVIGTL